MEESPEDALRFLVVDDDLVSREKLKAILQLYGACTAVSSGPLGLQAVAESYKRELPYDVITMDIEMPNMRGQEVVRRIREFERIHILPSGPHKAKILMVTVHHEAEHILGSFERGCEGYITKPVTPEKITQALIELETLPFQTDGH